MFNYLNVIEHELYVGITTAYANILKLKKINLKHLNYLIRYSYKDQ